jgi:hypothetical protein
MKSLTEYWVWDERLWISRKSPFFHLMRKIGDTLKVCWSSSSITYLSPLEGHINMIDKGVKLTKTDIKSAFRLLRVSPSDFDQLGFSFDNKFYFDKCLPFGASISFRLAAAAPSLTCWTQCLGMLRFLSALQFYLRLHNLHISRKVCNVNNASHLVLR